MPSSSVSQGSMVGIHLLLALFCAGLVGWIFLLLAVQGQGKRFCLRVALLQGRHWTSRDLWVASIWISGMLLLFAGVGLCLHERTMTSLWRHVAAALKNTLLQVVVAGVLFFRMRSAGGHWRASFGKAPCAPCPGWRALWQAALLYLLSLPLVVGAAWISQFLFRQNGGGQALQPVLELFSAASTPIWFRWWIVGVAVLIAPLVEEAFFRGVMLPVLLRKYAVWPALACCSLLFALVHGHAEALLPLFVFGLGLGWAYLYTGNLMVPIYMHALFNGINLLIVLLMM